jgi:hypothetical protein
MNSAACLNQAGISPGRVALNGRSPLISLIAPLLCTMSDPHWWIGAGTMSSTEFTSSFVNTDWNCWFRMEALLDVSLYKNPSFAFKVTMLNVFRFLLLT